MFKFTSGATLLRTLPPSTCLNNRIPRNKIQGSSGSNTESIESQEFQEAMTKPKLQENNNHTIPRSSNTKPKLQENNNNHTIPRSNNTKKKHTQGTTRGRNQYSLAQDTSTANNIRRHRKQEPLRATTKVISLPASCRVFPRLVLVFLALLLIQFCPGAT